jgi:hypothetical protein
MKKSRRVEITISSRKTLVVKQNSEVVRIYCKRCGEEVWNNVTKSEDLEIQLVKISGVGDEKGAKE